MPGEIATHAFLRRIASLVTLHAAFDCVSAFRRQVYRLQAVVMDGAAYAPFEL
jgi:hypothetical protein